MKHVTYVMNGNEAVALSMKRKYNGMYTKFVKEYDFFF